MRRFVPVFEALHDLSDHRRVERLGSKLDVDLEHAFQAPSRLMVCKIPRSGPTEVASLLIAILALDATIKAWRTGDRERVILVL